ncbi:MAG: hypothetical protein KKB50_12085 [Planctomycetes bacterium]|nr:hypothetical protein [Planctomycetota bacterium]
MNTCEPLDKHWVLFSRCAPRTALLVVLAAVVFDGTLARADSPYATQVVEYVPGTGIGSDPITGDPYHDPLAALGPPTTDTTGDNWFIPADEAVPVVPVYPPFRAFEVVTVGYGGHLIVAFDHAVEDHPKNPYGLDFIVFGNASLEVGGGQSWTNGDPSAVTVLTGNVLSEPGLVSVSQDGLEWYTYLNGPYADDFAPTLGRVYAPDNPDPGLGVWNEWWGAPADPTLPLDAELTADTFSGKTVAHIAELYSGSAGGTGFDIGIFGLDWIQYVRIENADLGGTPEIDAVVDVAARPVGGGRFGAARLDSLSAEPAAP